MGVMAEVQEDFLGAPLVKETAIEWELIQWTQSNIIGYAEAMSRKLYDEQQYRYIDPVWWQEIAAMGEMVSLLNSTLHLIYFNMGVVESNAEAVMDPFWKFALDKMGFIYNETEDRFDMLNNGLIGGIYYRVEALKSSVETIVDTTLPDLENRVGDLESSLGELTPEVIEKIELVAENIDEILEFMENGVEYLIGEVQAGVLTLVKGYVDPQINIIADGLDDLWLEVNRYGNVFIDVILSLINIMLTGVQIPADQIENIMVSINGWIIQEVTKQTASIQAEVNVLYDEVYLMSDAWIAALKKKLVI